MAAPHGGSPAPEDAPADAPATLEVVTFLGVVLVTRLVILVVIGHLLHGKEISDDSHLQLVLARDPFGRLTNTGAAYSQYPPLFGLLLYPVVAVAGHVVSDFYAIRLTAIAWEVLTAALFARALRQLGTGWPVRRWCYLAWLVVPMTWATSTVMGQKDFVAAFFVALTVLLAWRRSWELAALAAGVGAISAKVFLVLPLAVVVILAPAARRRRAAVAGVAPIALVYAYLLLLGAVQGNGLALLHFHPAAPFGTQGWTLLSLHAHLSNAVESKVSEVLAALGVLAVMGWWLRRTGWRRPTPQSPAAIALLVAAAMLAVFSLFYHVNDTYFTMVIALVLLPAVGGRHRLLVAAATIAPWAVNFFYGVQTAIAQHTVGGKAEFVRLYHHVLHISPRPLLEVSLAVTAVSWAALATMCARDAVRAESVLLAVPAT